GNRVTFTTNFNDVQPGDMFATEIGKILARGITQGCGGGNFCPDGLVTREQMAAFLIRARGEFNRRHRGCSALLMCRPRVLSTTSLIGWERSASPQAAVE